MPRATLTGWSLACTQVLWTAGFGLLLLTGGTLHTSLAGGLWLLLAVGIGFGVAGLPSRASYARPLLLVSSLVVPITLLASYPLTALTVVLSILSLAVLGAMLHPDTPEFLA